MKRIDVGYSIRRFPGVSAFAIIPLLLFFANTEAWAQEPFAGGSGSEEEPFQVESLEQLQAIGETEHLDKHFIQIADIHAGEAENGVNFSPIGSDLDEPFTGSYDGNGHIISGLIINTGGASGTGLFGYALNARIQNTGMEESSVTGGRFSGGLVGWFRDGSMERSFCKCDVTASSRSGGLVGYNWDSEIHNSYATGDVSGDFFLGGLTGINAGKSSITTSFATGNVTSGDATGGLVGWNDASVTDSYWDIESTGHVEGIGRGDMTGVTGRTTSEMTGGAAYDFMPALDFRRVWLLTEGYPALDWEDVEAIEPPELEAPPRVELISPEHEAIVNEIQPVFYWNEAWEAFTYQIRIATDDEFESVIHDRPDLEETSYTTEDSLQYNTTLYWQVRGVNPAGEGEWSETRSFTIPDTPFAGGSGTEEDPWLISSVEQLQAINDHPDAHFLQIRDINAGHTSQWNDGKGFNPIGWWMSWEDLLRFTGSYDGDGFEITGLVINRDDESNVGLFGYTEEARIENIHLVDASITGGNHVGGLVGQMRVGHIRNTHFSGEVKGTGRNIGGLVGMNRAQIENSSATGDLLSGVGMSVGGLVGDNSGDIKRSHASVEIVSQGGFIIMAGGLIGSNYSGTIENSYATGNITSTGSYAGGLIGSNSGQIMNCYAEGDVNTNRSRAGGLIGSNGGEVRNSHATGNVTGDRSVGGLAGTSNGDLHDSYATGDVSGYNEVGGLVGLNTSLIRRSHAEGDVTGNAHIGGLVGRNQRPVQESWATGNVTGSHLVGGLVGLNAGVSSVADSYALGDVEGNQETGGLVGVNRNDSEIHRSFSAGVVTGQDDTGGFAGFNDALIEDSYWDSETSGRQDGISSGDTTGATGLSTDQMTGTSAFDHMTGFNFYNTWFLTDGYPALDQDSETLNPPPAVITLLYPADGQEQVPVHDTLRWHGNEWIDEYQLQIATTDDFMSLVVDSTVQDTLFVYELDYETTWYWRVRARYKTGEDQWGDTYRSFTTLSSTFAGPPDELPDHYELRQNYPNPFNPVTQIRYALPEATHVRLEVYNAIGQRVAILVNEEQNAGWHETPFDAARLSSGVYLYRIQTNGFVESRQMLLIR